MGSPVGPLSAWYEVTTQPIASAEAPLTSAGPITFFFCIMMLEVWQKRSGTSMKSNSAVLQRIRSSAHFASVW